MLTSNRSLYLWLAITGGIFLISFLHGANWVYPFTAFYNSSRWLHFLAYASVAAIPVAAWRRGASIMFSLIPAIGCIAIESFQSNIAWPILRAQTIPADLFGLAAGVLLGLNIRVMRNSERTLENGGPERSHSETF